MYRRQIGNSAGYSEVEQLSVLLSQNMHRQATDPKDKIYSLLGLCNVDIIPDYSTSFSVSQLYRGTSAMMLKGTTRAEILTALLINAGLTST